MKRLVLGLVGQVCAGKSAVAEAFRRRGAAVYEADRIVHELYERDDVKQEVRTLLGDGVVGADGKVDRRKVAEVVFADAGKLKALTERIVFPRTGEAMEAQWGAFRSGALPGDPPLLLLDAPTLFEAGRAERCDEILFVSAPRARRERWAREKRGWPDGELARREARMMDEAAKRARCTAELVNDGSLEDLDRKVGDLWSQWFSWR